MYVDSHPRCTYVNVDSCGYAGGILWVLVDSYDTTPTICLTIVFYRTYICFTRKIESNWNKHENKIPNRLTRKDTRINLFSIRAKINLIFN
jgi:hypothetical protein